MKKYQLLEKAMRDYPKGTVARFKSSPHVEHISDGVFRIFEQLDDDNVNWEISVLCGDLNCVYSNGEWADVVPKCKHSFVCDKCKISTPIDQNNHGGVCFMCSRLVYA